MRKLADLLIGYSTKVKPGERVLIDAYDIPAEMVSVLIERVAEAGGLPFAEIHQPRVLRSLYKTATEDQMRILGRRDLEFMKEMQAYIALRGGKNINELSDVPDERMKIFREYCQKPVTDYRVNCTKWCVLRWPSPSMAQLAGMSTEQFEDFYFNVCTLDYAKMAKAEEPLKKLMERTDKVQIIGPNDTNLTFSIKGIPAIPCVGDRNIPDGECFTAPVKDSVNGVLHYNAGTIYQGKSFDDVCLVFKDGKIVEATSSDTAATNEIFNIE
jgi:aminopeptidase